MPPSAQRRGKGRKQLDAQDRSDVDDLEPSMTPSRKKRKVNNSANNDASESNAADSSRDMLGPPRRHARSSDIQVFEDEPSMTEEDEVNAVIGNLRRAKYDVQASIDYSNDVHQAQHPEGKQAYAKIAGNGWTFYVEDLEVRIGRPPDERRADGDETGSTDLNSYDKSLVHIDLGPSKLVSRQHAEIRYDEGSRGWLIMVNGRNGVRLDFEPLLRGQTAPLHSGTVIEIADTQMIFITPNEAPQIHSKIVAQTRSSLEEDDDDRDNQLKAMHPPALAHGTPTRVAASRATQNNGNHTNYAGQGHRAHQPTAGDHSAALLNDAPIDTRPRSSSIKPKTSPYQRGLMLETTEDIDYSLDSARDLKPPHSYAQLIGMAIMSSEEEKLTLSKIYDWIKEHYAFYRFSGGGWQNSIRHNLSLNKSFEKVARRTDEPGKGMKWQIVQEHREEVLKRGVAQPRGKTRSSGPNSPLKDGLSSIDTRYDNSYSRDSRDGAVKQSPGSTPPMANYPIAKQAFTPDRGGNHLQHLQKEDASSPRQTFGTGISPFPYSSKGADKLRGLTEAAAAGSPGGPTMLFNSDPDNPLMTPFITRNAPKLAPPSTAHLPSQFMPMSSPAPFWKYADLYGTPGRVYHGLDVSPEKKDVLAKAKTEDGPLAKTEYKEMPRITVGGLRSSSPPLPEGDVGQESPTKAATLRNGEKSASASQSQGQTSRTSISKEPHYGPVPRLSPHLQANSNDNNNSSSSSSNNKNISFEQTQAAFQSHARPEDDSEEEEGMIDLAKGFQTIGSFHRNMSAGAPPRFAASH